MCLNPLLIKNPNFGLSSVGLNRFRDCSSAYIPIPCGNCEVCVRLRQSYLVQRCQMESLSNHLFFLTFTYNNKNLPFVIVNGYTLKYPDWRHIQNMLKRIRKNYDLDKFRYLVVSEYGSNPKRGHRPHFHMILSYPNKGETFGEIMNLERKLHSIFLKEWRVNVGSTRSPIYENLCDYVVTRKGRTFDCHYINPRASDKGEEDVAFYVTKYCLKASKYVDSLKSALLLNVPDDFNDLWKFLKPRANISKGFGNPTDPKVVNYIRRCIDHSIHDSSCTYPYFINPVTGVTFPLSPYYRRKFMRLSDQEVFFNRNPQRDFIDDNYLESEIYNPIEVKQKRDNFLKVLDKVNARDISDSFIHENTFDQTVDFISETLETLCVSDRLSADSIQPSEDF